MSILNLNTLKTELLMSARNNVADPGNDRDGSVRGTSGTQSFTGDGVLTTFDISSSNVKNISGLTLNSIAQKEFRDFSVDYNGSNKGRITFTTAPGSLLPINVGYWKNDTWIFPEYPKKQLTLLDYPLMTIDVTSARSEINGLGATSSKTDFMVTVSAYSTRTWIVDDLLNTYRTWLQNNRKSFVNFPVMVLEGQTEMELVDDRENKVLTRSLIFTILNKVEF